MIPQQHRVSKEIHEFFTGQHPQSTGRMLASPVMYQIRPQFPPSPSQPSEADSCFMGRPFSHSRPGSQPRDKWFSACLSNTAGHNLRLPHHHLPHRWSELPGSWQRFQDSLDSLKKHPSWGVPTAFPAQTQDVERGGKVRSSHLLNVCSKVLLLPFRLES